MSNPSITPEDVIDELQAAWKQKQHVSVEQLLEKYPHLTGNSDLVLDLIYTEVLLREQNQETVEEDDYVRRFPEYREDILRQLQLHKALSDLSDADPLDDLADASTMPMAKHISVQEPLTSAASRTTADSGVQLQIPGFDVLGVAGRGGSGVAYRAWDQQLKRMVAIKLVQSLSGSDDRSRQVLLKEAEAAASLEHPSIVQVYQVGEIASVPFLVMEYMVGGSLADRLRAGPLSVQKAVDLLIDISAAVQFAHSQGIVHRDLKPGNILLDGNQAPHVCDFGLARQLNSELTLHVTGDVVGTPAYMPPEQARGERATAVADVYSLGAILYHALVGRPPFQAATPWEILNAVMTSDPIPIRQLNASLPRDLETICSAALHKNPHRRIATAKALADELDRFRTGRPIVSRPVSRAERLWKLCRRNALETLLISVAVIALLSAAIVSTLSKREVAAALIDTEAALASVETQRDVAFDAVNNLVYKVHDDLRKREASVEARGQVLRSAIDGLQRLIDVNGAREDLRVTMAIALGRYGYILTQQGRNEEAEQIYLQAIDLAETVRTSVGTVETAQGYCDLAAYYLRVVDFDKAIAAAETAIAIADQELLSASDNIRLTMVASRVRAHMASALTAQIKPNEALEIAEEALQMDRRALQKWPAERSVVTQLADINIQTGNLLLQLGQVEKAEQCINEAIPLIRQEGARSLEDAEVSRRLFVAQQTLAASQIARLKYADAMANLDEAMAGYQHLVDVEPNRPGYRLKLGAMLFDYSRCLVATGQLDQALKHAERQVTEFTKGMELGGPEYRVQRYAIARAYGQMCDIRLRQQKIAAAAQLIQTAADQLQYIAKEYQAEEAHANVVKTADVLFAVANQPSTASPQDTEIVRRCLDAWHANETTVFEKATDIDQQFVADIDQAAAWLKPQLSLLRCLFLGKHYTWLKAAQDTAEADLKSAAQHAVAIIQQTAAMPDNDPVFFLYVPDFEALRQTSEFQQTLLQK